MEEYGRYEFNQNQNQYQPVQPEAPKDPKKNHDNLKKFAKRAGAIALSAVLFGEIAGGTMVGINMAAGGSTQVSASTGDTSDTNSSKATLQTTSATSDGSTDGQSLDVSDVASSVMPSIVSITNKSVQEVQNYYSMFGMGGAPQTEEVESCGSGIIIGENDTELLIVTNNHVVENADTLTVGFIDNQAYEANIKGTDPDNDLAVVAVNLADISDDTMSQIKIATLGDSDALSVGQQVVAIGNALGYGQSVTTGIVSALDRQVSEDTEGGFIQTDAAINPGNSGGALINMNGEVVGINSAKLASTEVEGMGYAIPITRAQPILENLMNKTTREKVSEDQAAALSISGTSVDSSVAEAYGLPEGVYVAEVVKGGAADKAGITAGSVITAFDGTSVTSMDELKQQLQYYAAGETVDITIAVADNGQYVEKTVSITLDKADTQSSSDSQSQGNMQDSILQQGYLR